MGPVLSRPRPRPQPRPARSHRDLITVVASATLWLAIVVPLHPLLRGPSFVDEITVDNPHEWEVNIDVSDHRRDGWVGIGRVAREEVQTFEEILDQGQQWVFQFDYAEVAGGELTVNRSELERSGWSITVPDDFARRMRAAGVNPSPDV